MTCLNRRDPGYQALLRKSGLPQDAFDAYVSDFEARFKRRPNLDELPRANSRKDFLESLGIKNDAISVESLLNSTNSESVPEAIDKLNDDYRDLDIEANVLNKTALIDARRRPTPFEHRDEEEHVVVDNPNSLEVFSNLCNKLRDSYGINFHVIQDSDLNQWDDIPEVKTASAFVHNGEVYINTDLARVDAPIHELTHLLLGSIRFKDPELYFSLVRQAENFRHFEDRIGNYPNMTRDDATEEIFVEEVGRYLAGMDSDIIQLPQEAQYELHYNIKRLLDTVLMGQYSVKSIENDELYNMTLKDLTKTVNSMIMQPMSIMGLDEASLHRMLANEKTKMIKDGNLKEDCK